MTPNELMLAQQEFRLTCEEFAETICVSHASIQNWRAGRNRVNAKAEDRIKALLAMAPTEREKHLYRNRMKRRSRA